MNTLQGNGLLNCVHFVHSVTTIRQSQYLCGFWGVILYKIWMACDDVCSFVVFRHSAVNFWRDTDATKALQREFGVKHVPKMGKKCPQIGLILGMRYTHGITLQNMGYNLVHNVVTKWAKNAQILIL